MVEIAKNQVYYGWALLLKTRWRYLGGGGSRERHGEKRGTGFIPVSFVKFCCKLVSFLNTFTYI